MLVVVAVAGLAVAGCGSERQDRGPLRVYASVPIEGMKDFSADLLDGARLALRDAHGRAGDYAVRLVELDDTDPKIAQWGSRFVRRNAERAARDPDAVAYIGELDSGATALAMPILNLAGLPQVSVSKAVGLTRSSRLVESPMDAYQPTGRRTFLRLIPTDRHEAHELVRLVVRSGASRLFILDSGGLYGRSVADEVGRAARSRGVTVVAHETVSSSAPAEVRALSRRVSQTGADAVFYGGTGVDGREGRIDAGVLFSGLAAADSRLGFFGGASLANATFARAVGRAGTRTFVTFPGVPVSELPPAGKQFYSEFERAEGRNPGPLAIYGYEAMSAILDAIKRAQTGSGALPGTMAARRRAVARALMTIKDRDSVLGTYSVDRYGDTTLRKCRVYTFMKGKLVPIRRRAIDGGRGEER